MNASRSRGSGGAALVAEPNGTRPCLASDSRSVVEDTLDFGARGSGRWQRQLIPVAGDKGWTNCAVPEIEPATVGSGASGGDNTVVAIDPQQPPRVEAQPELAQQDEFDDPARPLEEQARTFAPLPAKPVATARTAAVTNPRVSIALDMDDPSVTFPLMHSIVGPVLVNNDRSLTEFSANPAPVLFR